MAGVRPVRRRSGSPRISRSGWERCDRGVTLAAYGIPVSLAYASLAGLPPQYGIYCYLVGGLFYALFGSSRQLAINPTSAISMLVDVTVAGMAQGDSGRWASIAALTALVIAAMCVLAWLFRLSSLVNFISETILASPTVGVHGMAAPPGIVVTGNLRERTTGSISSTGTAPTTRDGLWMPRARPPSRDGRRS